MKTRSFCKFVWKFLVCWVYKIQSLWTADKDANESDPRSNVHYLGSSESKAWKKIQACTGFEPMTSAILVQRSTNWANNQHHDLLPIGLLAQLVERCISFFLWESLGTYSGKYIYVWWITKYLKNTVTRRSRGTIQSVNKITRENLNKLQTLFFHLSTNILACGFSIYRRMNDLIILSRTSSSSCYAKADGNLLK